MNEQDDHGNTTSIDDPRANILTQRAQLAPILRDLPSLNYFGDRVVHHLHNFYQRGAQETVDPLKDTKVEHPFLEEKPTDQSFCR